MSAASAAAAAVAIVIVVTTAVALARAIVVDFILGGALPGVFDFNFAFDTP